MRRVVILLILGWACCGVSFAQFAIKGSTEDKVGQVCLVTLQDTLCKAKLKNGKFVLKGKTAQPVVGYLAINGKKYKTPLFIENADYQVTARKQDDALDITGNGKLQKMQQEFLELLVENVRETEICHTEMKKARAENDYFGMAHLKWKQRQLDSIKGALYCQFVAKYPNSLVGVYHLYNRLREMDYAELRSVCALLGEEAKRTVYGKVIEARYEELGRVMAGSVAPDFTLNTPEGKPVSLHGVKAKVKILDFWASWCGPCRAENPCLVELYKKYKEAGLEIVSVSLDSGVEPWEKAIKADGLEWIHVSSLRGWKCPVAALFQVRGVPDIFLLDADNRIVATQLRGEELGRKVEEMLR